MKDYINAFKKFFNNKEGNNKKKIENLLVLLVLLIITILAINFIWNDDKKSNISENTTYKQLASNEEIKETNTDIEKENLQANLKQILSKISGTGNVEVLITYSESSQVQAMYNENVKESSTQESDTNGGTRNILEKDVNKEIIYVEESGEKKPITQKVIMPKIEGAIIVAEGATNAQIKTNIIQAVEAATGLATHKIQVFEMN